jgi:hypothetical protein
VIAGILLGLSFLSHYDAIFFAVPIMFLLWKEKKIWYFLMPVAILVLPFYIPYITGDYFDQQTIGYLRRRMNENVISSSVFTYLTYNPMLPRFLLYFFAPFAVIKRKDKFAVGILLWFVVALASFEIVISNPGTHIHNYILPLSLLSAIGIHNILCRIQKPLPKNVIFSLLAAFLLILFAFQVTMFVPKFSKGYPWRDSRFSETQNKKFIYGFPYERGWVEIAEYLRDRGVRSFYTTDNVTIGEYYLLGIPADITNPHFYIHVFDNQEFRTLDETPQVLDYQKLLNREDVTQFYNLEKEIFVDEERTALIYKRIDN